MDAFSEKLFEALKKDDLKGFKSCMSENSCGALRLGRFPVLSIMYLYNSKRLLRAYEKTFLRINSWQDVGEPIELAAKFRKIVGKCLRLYLNETVSPVEMLLLLDRNVKLKKVYPQTHMAAPVKQRLKDIYYIRWGLTAEFVGSNIVLQRRPLKRAEKLRWAFVSVCIFLCVAIVAGSPFVANVISPFITDGEGQLAVTRVEQIKFASNNVYVLQKDVSVPQDFFRQEMNCELRGNGKTIKVTGDKPLFGEVNGKISDVTFETDGCPIVDTLLITGRLENVTVNAHVDKQVNSASSFVVNTNQGALLNVTLNVSGKMTSIPPEQSENKSFKCGGMVGLNSYTELQKTYYAVVQNCTANYNDFQLEGVLDADASFGGIVGTNDAYVDTCEVNGKISAKTFDVAGLCSQNNMVLTNSKNNAELSHTSDVVGWNPLVCGICLENYNTINVCENTGALTSESTCPEFEAEENTSPVACAMGIAYRNQSQTATAVIFNSTNRGAVSASGKNVGANASGICGYTNGRVNKCINYGAVSATAEASISETAGIAVLSYGYVEQCANMGELRGVGSGEVRVGGIVGTACLTTTQCISYGKITASGLNCYVGGILANSIGVLSGGSLYSGEVRSSIVNCEIAVTGTDASNGFVAVGGVVGYVAQNEGTMNDTGEKVYLGGGAAYCYFTGKLIAQNNGYFGGIVGVCGADLYTNSATEDSIQRNFVNNYYLIGCGVSAAYGSVVKEIDGTKEYKTVTDVGAVSATSGIISAISNYQAILELFGLG